MAEPYEIRIKITGEGAPQVKLMKRDLEGVKRAAAGTDKKLAAANRQTKALAGNMSRAKTQAHGMGLNIKRALGYFGVAAGGYMVVGQLKDASGMAMQLEKDLANVNTLLGRSHPMYNRYRDDIMKLKREVPVLEMQDLTSGLYETISAGVEAEGAMEATTVMAKAAAGGFTDLGGVVKGTTTVMNAYGIAGKDAALATDYGLKTVEKGKLNYGEYAEGISMVAGTAATAKVSLKELHAAISIASRVQRPEQTFTGLRMAIASLMERKVELRKMGIEVTTLADTLRQIKEKSPTSEEWKKIMPEMRGAETLKAVVLGYEDFVDVLKEFDDVSGTTMDKFNERMRTTEAKMKTGKTVIDEYKTAIGVELNEALITAIAGQKAFNKAAGEPIDTSGIEKFGDGLKEIAKIAGYVEKTVGKVSRFQWEMMGWDPLGALGKGRKFGPMGSQWKPAPEPVHSIEKVRAATGASAKPSVAAGGNTYMTVQELNIKSDKVDKDSLMTTLREVVEEEKPN